MHNKSKSTKLCFVHWMLLNVIILDFNLNSDYHYNGRSPDNYTQVPDRIYRYIKGRGNADHGHWSYPGFFSRITWSNRLVGNHTNIVFYQVDHSFLRACICIFKWHFRLSGRNKAHGKPTGFVFDQTRYLAAFCRGWINYSCNYP